MQAQMVALMRQQQALASQARPAASGFPAGYGGGMAMSPPSSAAANAAFQQGGFSHNMGMPPPSAVGNAGSGFDFMATDDKTKQDSSFNFVSDLMK